MKIYSMRDLIRWLTPFGIVDVHRRKFQNQRLGLSSSKEIAVAIKTCRYKLWPSPLRNVEIPWTLIDVGANIGDFTFAASKLASLKSVYAFEPQQKCHLILEKMLNSIPNSCLYKTAVGNKNDEIELYCTKNSKLSSILTPDKSITNQYLQGDFEVINRIKVPIIRLDDVIPFGTKVGLLKIDVQGYELPVLEGAAKTLGNTYALLLEINYVSHYEGGVPFDVIYEAVRKYGFRIFGVSEPYDSNGGPLWADAMFVNETNEYD